MSCEIKKFISFIDHQNATGSHSWVTAGTIWKGSKDFQW